MALNKDFDPVSDMPGLKKMSPFIIAILVLFLLWFLSPVVNIAAVERGVVFNKLNRKLTVIGPGFNIIVPFVEEVYKIDVSTRKSDTRATAASKDLQTVATEIVLNYHLMPDKVDKIYQEFKTETEKRFIDPTIQEVVKGVTAKFTAEELITKRQLVKEEMQETMQARMVKSHVALDALSITDFQFS